MNKSEALILSFTPSVSQLKSASSRLLYYVRRKCHDYECHAIEVSSCVYVIVHINNNKHTMSSNINIQSHFMYTAISYRLCRVNS